MRYGSVCSGIEAATMAWHPLGWSPVFFSEIEAFPSAVLAHHYGSNMPGEADASNGVPNHGDMTKFEEWPDHAIDLLVGGTPCQSFSVAGLRQGLADPRGNLMLTYLAIARRYRPRWLVWENVPGVLSSNGGRDFGTFIRGLEECGYHAAWRVLDAQYVRVDGFERAVPQRRRRVFVVGYLGDWRRPAAVLFEPEGMRGDSAPRRQAGQRPSIPVVRSVALRGREGGGTAELGDEIADTLRASNGGGDKPHALVSFVDAAARCVTAGYAQRLDWETENFVAHTLKAEGFDASEDGTGRGTPIVPVAFSFKDSGADTAEGVSPTLRSLGAYDANGGSQMAVAHAIQAGALRENPDSGPDGVGVQADIAYLLRKLLRYEPETGRLFWLERTIDLYPPNKRITPVMVSNWNSEFAGKEAFTAKHKEGYRTGRIFDRAYLAHRIIFAIVEGRFPPFVDHENGDRSDNRWSNLREATRRDNQQNMKMPKSNTSGHMGVRQAPSGKWQAQIHVGYKGYHLGMYSSLQDALTARKAAEKIFGFHKNHGRKP